MLAGMIFASVHNAKTCKKVGASAIASSLLLPILAVLSLRKAHQCGVDNHLAAEGLRPGSVEEAHSLVVQSIAQKFCSARQLARKEAACEPLSQRLATGQDPGRQRQEAQ